MGRPLMWFLAPDATFQPNELDLDPRTETFGMWVVGFGVAADTDKDVWALTLDNEFALLDNQLVKTIAYVDGNTLRRNGSSSFGVHPGAVATVTIPMFQFDFTLEGNVGSDGYVPRYFDRLYMLERDQMLGLEIPKNTLQSPANYGYLTRAQIAVAQTVTLFAEGRDQLAWDNGTSNMLLTAGSSVFVGFVGGSVTASQTDVLHRGLFGGGFVLTGELRLALFFNTLHVVGRGWRTHVPAGENLEDYVVEQGVSAGVEVNFDIL
jgi:hypothetical protein